MLYELNEGQRDTIAFALHYALEGCISGQIVEYPPKIRSRIDNALIALEQPASTDAQQRMAELEATLQETLIKLGMSVGKQAYLETQLADALHVIGVHLRERDETRDRMAERIAELEAQMAEERQVLQAANRVVEHARNVAANAEKYAIGLEDQIWSDSQGQEC